MLSKRANKDIREGMTKLRTFADKYKDYMNECLDNEVPVDKKKIAEFMKELVNVPA